MGLTVAEFWDMTPRTFTTLQKAWFKRAKFRDEQDWKRIRWSTCLLLNVHTKNKIEPQDLFVLESERPPSDGEVMDDVTRERLNAEWDKQERKRFLEKQKNNETKVSNP